MCVCSGHLVEDIDMTLVWDTLRQHTCSSWTNQPFPILVAINPLNLGCSSLSWRTFLTKILISMIRNIQVTIVTWNCCDFSTHHIHLIIHISTSMTTLVVPSYSTSIKGPVGAKMTNLWTLVTIYLIITRRLWNHGWYTTHPTLLKLRTQLDLRVHSLHGHGL